MRHTSIVYKLLILIPMITDLGRSEVTEDNVRNVETLSLRYSRTSRRLRPSRNSVALERDHDTIALTSGSLETFISFTSSWI